MIHPPTDDCKITEPEPKTTPIQHRKWDMQPRTNRSVECDDEGNEGVAERDGWEGLAPAEADRY